MRLDNDDSIRSDEGLSLGMSALEALYYDHFTSSTRLKKPNYLRLILSARSIFKNITSTSTSLTKNIGDGCANAGDIVYRRGRDGNGVGCKAFHV